jgi:hypothetical protein
MTSIMSIAVWNTIRLHSSEFHLTDFSCSAGSFSAITHWLPNRVQAENPHLTCGKFNSRSLLPDQAAGLVLVEDAPARAGQRRIDDT